MNRGEASRRGGGRLINYLMKNIDQMVSAVIDKGYKINSDEAKALFKTDFSELSAGADRIRSKFRSNEVKLCSIVNARSGDCPEDCKFCAQSAHNKAAIEKYPLVGFEAVEAAYRKAIENKASCFGIVTSGKRLSTDEVDTVCAAAEKLKGNIPVSVSVGELDEASLRKLKKCGIKKIHHNIETSESFFPNICTTHTFRDKINCINKAKELGFEVCSGVLFGLGESFDQRVEAAVSLRELGVDSVPINFYNPVKGTALEGVSPLPEEDILRTIAMFRFVLPDADIRVCGGREVNLKNSQNKIFSAGANGMMVGGYLTTAGRSVEQDHKMIHDAGFSIYRDHPVNCGEVR